MAVTGYGSGTLVPGQMLPVIYLPEERACVRGDLITRLSTHPLHYAYPDEDGEWVLAAGMPDGDRLNLGVYPDRDAAEEAFEAVYAYLGWPHGQSMEQILDSHLERNA